jgi:hypothetical protein
MAACEVIRFLKVMETSGQSFKLIPGHQDFLETNRCSRSPFAIE